jgi:hypothetical protein
MKITLPRTNELIILQSLTTLTLIFHAILGGRTFNKLVMGGDIVGKYAGKV